MTEMMFKRTFRRIAKTIDLHGATPHVLRHSFLTYAQTVVTDVKTLQAIAGQVDIQTTMNRYVHQQSDRIVETGKRVTDLFVKKCAKREVQKVLKTPALRPVDGSVLCKFCAKTPALTGRSWIC